MSPNLVLNQLEATNTEVSNTFLGTPNSELNHLQNTVVLNDDVGFVHAGGWDLLLVSLEDFRVVSVLKSLKK